jgi:hypothetical protein
MSLLMKEKRKMMSLEKNLEVISRTEAGEGVSAI